MQLSARLPGSDADHLVISITAPAAPVQAPRALALVIDQSQSMSGAALASTQAAVAAFVSELRELDAFSIIGYSDAARVIAPIAFATADAKRSALRAIEGLAIESGSCASCGLEQGAQVLASGPGPAALRRIVLVSDGHANLGLRRSDDLIELAAGIAAHGISITSIGVGLDADAPMLLGIADAGRGNHYSVDDVAQLGAAFDRELQALGETVAIDATLHVELPRDAIERGAELEAAYGYTVGYAHEARLPGSVARIQLADLRAGETRKVVLRVGGAPAAVAGLAGEMAVRLSWRRADDGAPRGALTVARVASDPDRMPAWTALKQALAGVEIERAAAMIDERGPAGAKRFIDDRAGAVEATGAVSTAARQAIDASLAEASEALRRADTTRELALTQRQLRAIARQLMR